MIAVARTLLMYVALTVVAIIAPAPVELFADDDCPRCVKNIDPEPGGDSGGTCPASVDAASCMSRCDCKYAQNRQRCGTDAVCIDTAHSMRNGCYEYCADVYGD